jgi:hypothetical protein
MAFDIKSPIRYFRFDDQLHIQRATVEMPTRQTQKRKEIARAPAGMLALQRSMQGRLVSSGGRPADPAPTIRRLVTVRKDVWRQLQKYAALLSTVGDRVSPGQLAAILLEESISHLDVAR